jgi:hypothetical protein
VGRFGDANQAEVVDIELGVDAIGRGASAETHADFQLIDLGKGEGEIDQVGSPDFRAVLMPDAIDGQVPAERLDLVIDFFLLAVIGDPPVLAEEFNFQVKVIVGDSEIVPGQPAKGEAKPLALGEIEIADHAGHRPLGLGGRKSDAIAARVPFGVAEESVFSAARKGEADRGIAGALLEAGVGDQVRVGARVHGANHGQGHGQTAARGFHDWRIYPAPVKDLWLNGGELLRIGKSARPGLAESELIFQGVFMKILPSELHD